MKKQLFVPVLAAMAIFVMAPAAYSATVTYNLSGEPKTLDSALATGVLESHVITQLIEGLVRLDENGQATPGTAEKWEISDNKTSYTFFLRDAQWSNGDAVTAGDFVFGWTRTLAPATAAEYAYQLYPVKGAEAYNKGQNSDPAAVGVTVENSKVLTVTLKNPTPYFLSLLGHYAFNPLNEKWVGAHPDWALTPAEYLVNGPFQLAEWRHRDQITLKKNPQYYAADKVRLDEIIMTMISNEATALLQWETGKIDIIETHIPLPDVPRLKKQGVLQTVPYLGTYYVALQHEKKPFDDPRVRRAFALAVDREQITRAILRGGQPEALALVPPGIDIEGVGDYRKSTGDLFKQNVAEAKKLLAAAGYPNGRGLPPVRYTYNDLQMHRTIGEALQRMWLENLGVRVQLQVQEYKVYIQTLHSKNFQTLRAGWIGDFIDPTAFLDMFVSGAGNNSFNYSSDVFDGLLQKSRQTTDTVARTALLRQAEKQLIAEDMAVIPLFYYVNHYLQKPHVKGVVRNPTGTLDFREAYLDSK